MNRSTPLALTIAALAALHGADTALATDYTYTVVDSPAASYNTSRVTGVSGTTVVGYYYDSQSVAHGFKEASGSYTTVDDPSADTSIGTTVYGVCGSVILGAFSDGPRWHGFSETGGLYSTLDDPASTGNIRARGMSGNTVVGEFWDGRYHGFTETNGLYTTLDSPSAIDFPTDPYNSGTHATGISGNTVVGYFRNITGWHGFSEMNGGYTTLDDPAATANGLNYGTYATGISGDTIAGFFIDSSDNTHGFTDTGGVYTTWDYPGAPSTTIDGISGTSLAGNFGDGVTFHGFIATSIPEPASLSVLVLGTMGALARRRNRG